MFIVRTSLNIVIYLGKRNILDPVSEVVGIEEQYSSTNGELQHAFNNRDLSNTSLREKGAFILTQCRRYVS